MEVKDIVEFLKSHPGYKKEGAKRLATKVLKGKAAIEDCREALQIVNDIVKKTKATINTHDFGKDHQEFQNKINNFFVQRDIDFEEEALNKAIKELKPAENLKLRSRWQSTNGEWLESYRAVPNEESELTKQDIEEAVKSALTDVKPLEGFEPFLKDLPSSNKSMLVWTSDKHIGADTTETQYSNPYNKQVFIKRMSELAQRIIEKSVEYKGLDTLVIADLGDATDGQDGYTASRSHRLPQNMTNREVFETYITVHMAFVDYLVEAGIANNYEFWFNTNSNHGGSYEFACHKALQLYIVTKYPFVTVKSFDDFLGHTHFKGITYLLTHGKDDKNRKFGLPLYPDAKTEVFIDNYLKMNKLSFDPNIRLIKGDLHQSASLPCKNINRYRNVASLFGASGWVMDNFGFTPAGCDYEIVDGNEILEGTFWFE